MGIVLAMEIDMKKNMKNRITVVPADHADAKLKAATGRAMATAHATALYIFKIVEIAGKYMFRKN